MPDPEIVPDNAVHMFLDHIRIMCIIDALRQSFCAGLGLAANADNFGLHLTHEPPALWLTNNHIETGMDGVLIGLEADLIACAAAVRYEDHGQRVDVEFIGATVQMFGLAFLLVVIDIAEDEEE